MESKEIKQFIGQLSDEELRVYLYAFIDEDETAGAKLCDFINRQLNAVGMSNAEVSVERSFDVIKNVGDRWHSNWIRDWDRIYSDSYTLFERARNAIATGNPDIALSIGTRWLECFADNFDEAETYYYDDEGVCLGSACENAIKIIDEAITAPNVSDNTKRDIAKRLSELSSRRDTPFDNYYYVGIGALATRINVLSLSDKDALTYLEDLLTNDFNDATLIKQKYRLLLNLGRQHDAESFIEENIDNQDVADYYIAQLFEGNRIEKLIPILKDLTDPDYETHNRPTRRWLETLAKCQEQLGLKDDVIETYSRLFVHSMGDLEYYRILKKMVGAEEWPQYLDELIQQAQITDSGYFGKCNYADILIEEGRLQDLHDWLKTKSEGAFAYYLHMIPGELRTDLIPIYRNQILDEADRAKKRSSYARLCEHIAKIKALPEGEPTAKEIGLQSRINTVLDPHLWTSFAMLCRNSNLFIGMESKTIITTDSGVQVNAQAPVVISARDAPSRKWA